MENTDFWSLVGVWILTIGLGYGAGYVRGVEDMAKRALEKSDLDVILDRAKNQD